MRLIPGLDRDGLTAFVFGRRRLRCWCFKPSATTLPQAATATVDTPSIADTTPSASQHAAVHVAAVRENDDRDLSLPVR
jgi:hypothetical protein